MIVTVQGAIIVNHCRVEARGDRVVALSIDLCSEYVCVTGVSEESGVPTIMLGADERTLNINQSRKAVSTELQFPDYAGWQVFADRTSRYTLRVCLVRPKKSR